MAYAPFDLTGKVALITGGNRGIGFGMAEALAQSGADVAIWGRGADRNAEAVEKLVGMGVKAKGYAIDVGEEEAVIAGFAQTVADFGRVDFVAANAGMGTARNRGFAEMPTELYRTTLRVNLDGAFFTLRAAAKHMIDRAKAGDPGGSLVGVGSIAAIEGAPREQPYAAAKGGLISMMKGIAVECARHGIRSNTILPGWIATELTEVAQGSQAITDKVIGRVPIRRWGKPEEFGGIAVYLASDASTYHSGDVFVIDGAYTLF